jgi:murein DD-endopeptidase MepM/ murein hydrolase activator NlpD
MLKEKDLVQYFKFSYLPIADDAFWNGKPGSESNLPEWSLHFTQMFGENLLDYGQFGLKGHNGIDIGFREGCPIVSPGRLWISYLQDDPNGYGRNVWAETESKQINGDYYKLELCFAHAKEFACDAYNWADIGKILAYGDSTGFSTGHHLHFGIRPYVKIKNEDWKQMFPDNGYKGWIEPMQFFKITNNPNIMDLTNLEKKIVIEGTGSGRVGIIINGKLREVKTERVAQACLYVVANNGLGKTISSYIFNNLPRDVDF